MRNASAPGTTVAQVDSARPRTVLASMARCVRLVGVIYFAAIFIAQASCVPTANGCFEGTPACNMTDWISIENVTNPHFEFVQSGLTASKDFWLRKDDQLRFKWDDFAYLFHKPGHDCDFAAATIDTNYCQRCRWCNQNNAECGIRFAYATDDDQPALVTYSQNMPSNKTSEVIRADDGCGSLGHAFTPAENSTIQLKAKGFDQTPLVETSAFVVTVGAGQIVTYELKSLDQAFDRRAEDGTFFSATVPPLTLPGGPGLEDNFSRNLHVSKVRVLKVKKQPLPLKGRPAQDVTLARPSRLVFIPSFRNGASIFDSDGNHCFRDDTKVDGDFDLTRCRGSLTSTVGNPLTITPSYLGTAPTELLTWVAEFKPSEQSMFPAFDSQTEMLVIEFTIEANVQME